MIGFAKQVMESFAVQPHSQGPLYPAVIATVERYSNAGEYLCTAYALTLDGRTEEYATYDDAAEVARGLLADPAARISWRSRATKSEQSPAYGRGFIAYS